MQKLFFISFFCLPFVCAAADDGGKKVYRWVADDGSVTFSAVPPPSGVEAKEFELRDADTVIKQDKAYRRRLLNQSEQQTLQAQGRREEREKIKQEIAAAEKELAKVRQDIDQGKTPRPGEIQRLTSGKTKLSPAYFERLKSQEKRLEDLEKRIDELNEELQKTF